MRPVLPRPMMPALVTPLEIPGLETWYDTLRPASTTSDYIRIDASNRVSLLADTSGNSATNVLLLPQVTGNRCSLTTGTAIGTGDVSVSLTFQAALTAITGGVMALSSNATSNNLARAFFCETRSGAEGIWFTLIGATTADFRTFKALNFSSTYAGQVVTVTFTRTGTTFAAYVTNAAGVTATLSGSEATGGTPPAWSDTITSTNTNIGFAAGTESQPGAIYRAAVYSKVLSAAEIIANAAGTVQTSNVVFVNFALAAKLATSFTATSGQTVSITTSGATGARISGARDLYQGTALNMQVYSTASGRPLVTGDGTNQRLKSAPYSASQPRTRFTVFKHNSWTIGDVLWDGNAAGSAKLSQAGTTPNLQLNAGSAGPQLATFVLGTWAVCVEIINAASSELKRNLDTANGAAAGAGNPSGTTIGSDGAGANCADMSWQERLEYSGALTATSVARVVRYLFTKWGVPAP